MLRGRFAKEAAIRERVPCAERPQKRSRGANSADERQRRRARLRRVGVAWTSPPATLASQFHIGTGGPSAVANRGTGCFLSAYWQTSYFTTRCRFRRLPNLTLAKLGDMRLRKTDAPRVRRTGPTRTVTRPLVAFPVSFPFAVGMWETNFLAASHCPFFPY